MFQIGDLKVEKLSGPVTFRYLLPKKEVFLAKAAENVFLPIVILLGDEHTTEERCTPCNEEKRCYDVSSKTFLKAFNKIARDIPIDMYTEYRPKPFYQTYVEGHNLFGKFAEQTFRCHKVAERASGLYDCKYPNIRWHYTDVRDWSNKFEFISHQVDEYLLMTAQVEDLSEARPFSDNNPSNLFIQLLTLLKNAAAKEKTLEDTILAWARILSKAIIGNQNSVIYKQFAKYNIDANVELYIYKSLMAAELIMQDEDDKRILHKMKVDEIFPSLEAVDDIFRYVTEGILEIEDPETDIEYLHHIAKMTDLVWVQFTACLLDLYFIGRMFKPPRDNINSYVTVGFFGDLHSTRISEFLSIHQDWYDVKYEIRKSNCLRFKHDVNFNQDLKKYVVMREKVQDVEPYITQLQRELQSRVSSRKQPHIALLQPWRSSSVAFSEEVAGIIYEYAKKLVERLTKGMKSLQFDPMFKNIQAKGNELLAELASESQEPLYSNEWMTEWLQSITSFKRLQPYVVNFVSMLVQRFINRIFEDSWEFISNDDTLTTQHIQQLLASERGEYLRLL